MLTDPDTAEHDLLDWAATVADRDARVLTALLANHSKNRVHTLTGIARTTIDDILKEYPVVDTAAILRAKARAATGMTAPEFDHSLSTGDGRAVTAMNGAAYELANRALPPVRQGDGDDVLAERRDRAEALWTQAWPEIEAMISRAKAMKFLGWSDEARARGGKIRYATADAS